MGTNRSRSGTETATRRDEGGARLMDLEQLEIQRSGPAGRNPVMPALLAGIHDQDEMFVAIHFDRDPPSGRALRTMRQSSIGGGHRGRQSPVGCGHRNTIRGGLTSTIRPPIR